MTPTATFSPSLDRATTLAHIFAAATGIAFAVVRRGDRYYAEPVGAVGDGVVEVWALPA